MKDKEFSNDELKNAIAEARKLIRSFEEWRRKKIIEAPKLEAKYTKKEEGYTAEELTEIATMYTKDEYEEYEIGEMIKLAAEYEKSKDEYMEEEIEELAESEEENFENKYRVQGETALLVNDIEKFMFGLMSILGMKPEIKPWKAKLFHETFINQKNLKFTAQRKKNLKLIKHIREMAFKRIEALLEENQKQKKYTLKDAVRTAYNEFIAGMSDPIYKNAENLRVQYIKWINKKADSEV